ncbi:phenylalanine--tRNA ligase subunit alpha [Boudabousia marimammalium]|uniref:Phenylalanine--tRNA ligase alpha subunit n=1 Tax=Boudabousia marimammalium TaxID=156892 RepID=A0A1Q5PNQ2_9ACTO|nr:phenylalanine--tRNA ligase subunit alpha [Boudabousia marimammalium]OKL49201.1 phenylalanine--tRNA ligase subunit alpha [Boudabousia marimammalium]
MTVPDRDSDVLSADRIEAAVREAVSAIEAATSIAELKQVRNRSLGEGSVLANAKKSIKDVPPADRKVVGKMVGEAKGAIERAVAFRTEVLEVEAEERLLREETVDVTVASPRHLPGGRHPLELVMDEIADFFSSMGWQIGEGPEIEHEWFNFDALNLDPDHPARQMQDTLYVDPASVADGSADSSHLVMRTHTSPVQARVMTSQEPPIYLACPGKVFRSDELDQTHSPVFHQVEGLAVDKGLTMAHLKGVLDAFARHMFGPEAKTRLRPSFFPFTEPSAEMDLWFPQKKGGPGWIEWGGCGMVNPNVLIACGIDPKVYQGFAFGMGVERTLMLRHGISDMHDIVEGDVRFSQQFGITGKGK